MTHGDDAGLRLPPKVAPVQVVIVIVKDDPDAAAAGVAARARAARQAGLRVRVDARTDLGLGRRLTDWELKGVPVRIEVGPRDLAQGTVSIARRDRAEREPPLSDTLWQPPHDRRGVSPRRAARPGHRGAAIPDGRRGRSRCATDGGARRIRAPAMARVWPPG